MANISFNPATQDFTQFYTQMQTNLSQRPVWKGQLTTQTSTTLVEMAAAIGAYNQGRAVRAYEDAFSETAQNDDAIYAITQMQGLRISRKLPSAMEVSLVSTINATLNPLTQFTCSGQYFFNKTQIVLTAGVAQTLTLYQGQVQTFSMNGLGSARQTFLSEEDEFTVSDQDVRVFINNTLIPKALGGLWNYRNLPAYGDLTTNDGRLLIVFGSEQFGSVPEVSDVVVIQYPTTFGAETASLALVGRNISIDGLTEVTGTALTNPTGGGNEPPVETYKNLSSGSFGTYDSAVTKSQYLATVGTYPGVIDSVTQAQRDINPLALEWMNVMRVSALTTSPWSQQQKQDYIKYLQKVTMYAPRFVWQDPIPVPRDVVVTAYCFNTAVLSKVKADIEAAYQALFGPRPGLMMTNFYESDLDGIAKSAGLGAVSYVVVESPTSPMIVTLPISPESRFTIVPGAGTLEELIYSYAVSSVSLTGEEGTPANWVFPQIIGAGQYGIQIEWDVVPDTASYKVWGRKGGSLGLLATVNAGDPLVFLDDGSITPVGPSPSLTVNSPIRYNTLNSLTVKVEIAERQQRIANTIPTRGQT